MFKKLAGGFAVIAAGLFWSGWAMAQTTIVGSAHDFQSAGTAWVTTDQICIVCHAPHNNANAAGEMLWNRGVTTATFTNYSSSSMSSNPTDPAGTSVLCLSCHDGTIAIDSYGNLTGANSLGIGDPAYVGFDLSNDHPISFTYPTTAQDPEIKPSSSTITVGPLTGQTIANALLDGGEIQCQSCHDVHNTNTDGPSLLAIRVSGSDLCLTCHSK